MKKIYAFLKSSRIRSSIMWLCILIVVFIAGLNLVLPEILRMGTQAIKEHSIEGLIQLSANMNYPAGSDR